MRYRVHHSCNMIIRVFVVFYIPIRMKNIHVFHNLSFRDVTYLQDLFRDVKYSRKIWNHF
jgi:hypothetical protein